MDTIAKIGINCVGCRSCEQSCPKKCITFRENSEGFLYPVIMEDSCIKCGICLKRCPISMEEEEKRQPLECYALKEKDKGFLMNSASGGASDLAVKAILDKGGYAYGAAYSPNYSVIHIEVSNEEGRKKLQSSKYVQSDLKDTFSKAKARLEDDKIVLFTGTPCQIAGLYAFLGKNFNNLYTIDLICHGVPSPKFFEKYLAYQEKIMKEHIEFFDFRSKDKRGWGKQYLIKTETKKKTKPLSLDKYGKHFMDGDCYRESCYHCKYANLNRPADLTVGDFWGIDRCHPEFSSPLGVSSVLVNTEKGKQLFEFMKRNAEFLPVSVNDVLFKQGNLVKPSKRTIMRENFYKNINSDTFIEKLQVGVQVKERIKSVLPRTVLDRLKRINWKGMGSVIKHIENTRE